MQLHQPLKTTLNNASKKQLHCYIPKNVNEIRKSASRRNTGQKLNQNFVNKNQTESKNPSQYSKPKD